LKDVSGIFDLDELLKAPHYIETLALDINFWTITFQKEKTKWTLGWSEMKKTKIMKNTTILQAGYQQYHCNLPQ
jgi:hypothetical protein